ncbi:FK506-binding protein 4 [Phytophthora cinnamomi]|uniref:FK506-binding protein 4 n=1 Tax=Phytophthora cinnamomi TaxID=4785 RepID=UPI003559EF5E|nr:FK506-binding protein 4 [Phytophthora cinnamomi]
MDNVPRCLSTVRFHQALNEGVLKEHEVRALETNRRLRGELKGKAQTPPRCPPRSCLQREKTDIRQCAQLKTLLERCMRSKTEDLVKASQPQVFRPSAVP